MHQPRGQSLRFASKFIHPARFHPQPRPVRLSSTRGVFCPLAASTLATTPDPKHPLLPSPPPPPPPPLSSSPSATLQSPVLVLCRAPFLRALSPMETSLIGRTKGRKKRGHPRIRPITVNVRDNTRDICRGTDSGKSVPRFRDRDRSKGSAGRNFKQPSVKHCDPLLTLFIR